jgi:regulator of protease activity HflC (stomatin/prohibitin superfamily)
VKLSEGCFVAVVIVCLLGCALWLGPKYQIYRKRCVGEAELAQSEHQKKILVEQARAEMEAAKLRAEAIQIVGKASQEFPEYRHQEFIGAFAEALKEGNIDQIIYVPTETNVPIVTAAPR